MDYPALRDVNVTILKGEFVAVVGPSGSGKTTFLNLIGTLDRPTRGEIFIDGVPISKMKSDGIANLRNKRLGFVFQSYNLIPYLDAAENVELPLMVSGLSSKERRDRAALILTELEMGNFLHKKPNELSGGQQQRVAIARALANNPSLILADEPTGNLDSKSSETVISVLERICRQTSVTILMVTHNLEITRHCRRVIFMKDGMVEKEVEQN